MNTLGIMANCRKPRTAAILAELETMCREAGLALVADQETSTLLRSAAVAEPAAMFDSVDAVMALGGDGTMLKVARDLAGRDKPVIGVNSGALGFLTSVSEEELARAVKCLATDSYDVAERAVVESVILRQGVEVGRYRALNEVVVGRWDSLRVVMLDVAIDDGEVTSYHCDGLMISTPTGSTGHSLSAGGPIVMPETGVFVISVICPHTLSTRPLVVPDGSTIAVGTATNSETLIISVDGQASQRLEQGDRILSKKATKGVRFIHLPGHSYFAVLRQKLHWRGSAV